MPPVLAAALCFVTYVLFYRFYARHLGSKVFKLDPNAITPAHAMKDGIDYVPARKDVLFGHHYASIAGLAPMLGPAIAVIWGWLPGMVWVVLGTLLVGAVHDFSALVVSMRNKGMSIGKVAEDLIGKRAKSLFLLIILFLICLVMGVFVGVVADLVYFRFLSGGCLSDLLPDGGGHGDRLARLQEGCERFQNDGRRFYADDACRSLLP